MHPTEQSGHTNVIRKLMSQSRKRIEKGIEVKLSYLAVKSRITVFPLEIQYHIMDYLGGRDAIRAKQQLRWTLPASYWRTRIDTVRYYEMEYLPNEEYDWEYLCLRLEAPWRASGREGFMKVIRAIRQQFYCVLKGQ